jgi:IS1 family transposase
MTGPNLTSHARQRMVQRAISNEQLALILLHGTQVDQKGGTVVCRFGNREYRRLTELVSRCRNKAVVIDPATNTVITTFHFR